ncbi:LysR family transcriptional regulator [Vibrio rotiferianus]|uniref:LysR family transcriptional regulator n=1 Tax=Vibrio rotiferianus TaxID=190895 RepID=UPI0015F3B86A|nr:LysR family transcriptional regulator [Vibrio rotiferianus]
MSTNSLFDIHKLLPHLATFRLVAERGSFQSAANELNLPRSSVSKKIRQLEEIVEQRLLQRTTRKLTLTEAGEALLNTTQELPSLIDKMETFLLDQQTIPSGKVKISCSTLLGQHYLLPQMKYLVACFPQIQFQLSFDDNCVDLIESKIDIAIRIGELPDSPMLARKIGEKRWCFVASDDYLKVNGYPTHPNQLVFHQCLVFANQTSTQNHWQFVDENKNIESVSVEGAIQSDDARALVELLKQGVGIARLDPNVIASELESGELTTILDSYTVDFTAPIQLLCLGKATHSKASRAVWDELARVLPPRLKIKK